MTYKSNIPQITTRMKAGTRAGLTAAADVVVTAIKEKLDPGYTSGDFATGETRDAVRALPPEETADGMHVRVGTDLIKSLLWEIGHVNVFTKKFERVEVWLPTLLATRDQQRAAFEREYRRFLGSGGPGGFTARAASPGSPR